jgi:hypothetical protein
MLLSFPIIVSLILLLEASIGTAVNSKDKGKRKIDDTSFESQQSSSASQRPQHSGNPQPSHHGNEPPQHPQHQQALPLQPETQHREPQFGLSICIFIDIHN